MFQRLAELVCWRWAGSSINASGLDRVNTVDWLSFDYTCELLKEPCCAILVGLVYPSLLAYIYMAADGWEKTKDTARSCSSFQSYVNVSSPICGAMYPYSMMSFFCHETMAISHTCMHLCTRRGARMRAHLQRVRSFTHVFFVRDSIATRMD